MKQTAFSILVGCRLFPDHQFLMGLHQVIQIWMCY